MNIFSRSAIGRKRIGIVAAAGLGGSSGPVGVVRVADPLRFECDTKRLDVLRASNGHPLTAVAPLFLKDVHDAQHGRT